MESSPNSTNTCTTHHSFPWNGSFPRFHVLSSIPWRCFRCGNPPLGSPRTWQCTVSAHLGHPRVQRRRVVIPLSHMNWVFLPQPLFKVFPHWGFSCVWRRITAMVLVWEYGERSGYESWKGLSWGMVCMFSRNFFFFFLILISEFRWSVSKFFFFRERRCREMSSGKPNPRKWFFLAVKFMQKIWHCQLGNEWV